MSRLIQMLSLLICCSVCLATEDQPMPISFVHIKADYRIEPFRANATRCPTDGCDATPYEGVAELEINIDSKTRQLIDFEFRVNGEPIPIATVANLRQHRVQLRLLELVSTPAYIPRHQRHPEIVGVSSPVISILGLRYEAPQCEFKFKQYWIAYDLETRELHTECFCWVD